MEPAMLFLPFFLPLAWGRPAVDMCTARLEVSTSKGVTYESERTCAYHVHVAWQGEARVTTTYRLESEVHRASDIEGDPDAKTRFTALDLIGPKRILWTVEERGDRAWVWRDAFLVSTQSGCCAALDLHVFRSLSSGRTVFQVAGDVESSVVWAEIPNSGGILQYASLFAGGTDADERVFGGGGALASITWASQDEASQRLAVLSAEGASAPETFGLPSLQWLPPSNLKDERVGEREVRLWSADGQKTATALTGLTLRVTLLDGRVLDVPLRDGRLRTAEATLPDGLRLTEIPPE